VTNEYRRQPGTLFERGPMPVGPTPVLDRGQRAGKTALGRGLPHHVLAIPRLSPRVGEAEEVERWVLAVWGHPTTSLRAEVDEARLVRMQLEAESAKPFLQHVPYRSLVELRALHAGCLLGSLRHPPRRSRRTGQPSVLTSPNLFSTRHHQRFACARLSQPCLPRSCPDVSATFTTVAFDDSGLRWLEIST
jgi:hypothetical protein